MSWAEEDWTVGLSGRVLQKVKELQVHQDRLSRDNRQKQLQLDNINTSLEKQTVKYEEVRAELQSVQRELQSVRDEAKAAVTFRERLTQELQTKQAQICSFEGQLDAARTQNSKLTQEVKRLEAELEKLQNSSRTADTTLFSTPCWNSPSPWEPNGSRNDERPGRRDEGQSRASHIRQRLQFSEVAPAPLSRQQHKNTPHRHSADQSDIFSTPTGAFPWERDDSKTAAWRRSPSSPQTPSDVVSISQPEQRACGMETDHKAEKDTSLSEMQGRVSALEEELSVKAGTLMSIQKEMAQSKKELAAKELSVQRVRDELSMAHTRIAKESERASEAEQRLRQLQEELKCQRQNAESIRLQHQQRTKDLERQHQRDLTELQKERQCLEKQHQQEVNKLSQELQQARSLHNALQAQADKLSLQKQALDKELDTVKEKLKWTEGQLQESQKKEAQTHAKLMEAVREAEGVAVSLEQSRKRERALEEEGKRLAEEQADALRRLKELQEQQAAQAPLQPVQFCPVGQSFSPQPSYPFHSQPSAQNKRSSTTKVSVERREGDVDKRRAEITAAYPSDREPGEGIDSEHISKDSECFQREGHKNNRNEPFSRSRNESDCSGTTKHSSLSAADTSTNNSVCGDPCSLLHAENTPTQKSEQAEASEDLRKENAELRRDLQDVREELQKRLEDLEGQRRAEAEAKTRLKQLSRKSASQAAEKEEQEKGWREKLEGERAETERLKKAIAALESETKRGKRETEIILREEQEEEKNKALADRESEMIELNIQLKKQLSEVKAQLALEQDERKREEEERKQMNNADNVKNELSKKLEELTAELEDLKRSRNEELLENEKLSVANSPLTYLTLRDDELNSNTIGLDNKLVPSPVQQLLFCQSTNQRNMLVSQVTADLIQNEQSLIDPENLSVTDNGKTGPVASNLEDSSENLHQDEPALSDIAKEMEQLQKQKEKETERANQNQVKLEALQSQVTRQTQQLTMAFEKQSQHITGLLAELQEKESALLSQGEELQHLKQELDTVKAQQKGEKMTVRGEEDGGKIKDKGDKSSVAISELKPNQETSLEDRESGTQSDVVMTSVAERPTTFSDGELLSGEQRTHVIKAGLILSNRDSALVEGENKGSKNGGTLDISAELLAPRQENQLLEQRVEGLNTSDTKTPSLHTPGNIHNLELKEPSEANNINAEREESTLQNVKRSRDEGGHLEREERRTPKAEEEQEAESELQIVRLQQQVVELQKMILSLSEETKQQAEELAVWRLASQPAPSFDFAETETQDQIPDEIIQSQTQVGAPSMNVQESPGNVTVIREDELLLSCSSNKLQGRMLFSRLQQSNVPERKILHPFKETAALQENIQDNFRIDTENEKENLDINVLHQSNICQTHHNVKKDSEVFQMSSERMTHQHVSKEFHKVSGPKQTSTSESSTKSPEAKTEINDKINTTSDASDGRARMDLKSVGSQTEESFYPPRAQTTSDFHCVFTQTEEEEDEAELVESPPVSPVSLVEGAKAGNNMMFSGSFPIPADPARLAERIRRNRTQLSAAFDDTEYEPYGLPEVVMKGFADIPSGPSCPYIVRRGLLGTTVVPAAQKEPGQETETD